jgi:hypothetical protein
MLRTVDAAYEESIIFMTAEGQLDIDDESFSALARQLNPEVEYWKGSDR